MTLEDFLEFVRRGRAAQAAVDAIVRPSITCPVCQRVSYNPNDVAQQYCGFCHRFHMDHLSAAEKNS
jgi:hypothetical protein